MDRLPGKQRAQLEHSYAMDLSGVRVHADSAEASALGAEAFARGADLHFAPGRYAPGTDAGDTLIAHEVAHVAQQAEGRVGATLQAKGLPVNLEPALEDEADRMAAGAMAGRQVRSPSSPLAAPDGPGVAQGYFRYQGKILFPDSVFQHGVRIYLRASAPECLPEFEDIAAEDDEETRSLEDWLRDRLGLTFEDILEELRQRVEARRRGDVPMTRDEASTSGDDEGAPAAEDEHGALAAPPPPPETGKKRKRDGAPDPDEPKAKRRRAPFKLTIGRTKYDDADTFVETFADRARPLTAKQKRDRNYKTKTSPAEQAKSTMISLGLSEDDLVEGIVLLKEQGKNRTFSTWGPAFVRAAAGALKAEKVRKLPPVPRGGPVAYAQPSSASTYDPNLLTAEKKLKRNKLLRKQGSDVVSKLESEDSSVGRRIKQARTPFRVGTPGLQRKRPEKVTEEASSGEESMKVDFQPTTYSIQNGNFLIGGGGGDAYQELIKHLKTETGLGDAALAERLLRLLLDDPIDLSAFTQRARALMDKFEAIFRFAETRRASLSVVGTAAALNHVIRTDEDLYDTLRHGTLHVKTEERNKHTKARTSAGGAAFTRIHKEEHAFSAKETAEMTRLAAREYDLIMELAADNGVDTGDKEAVQAFVRQLVGTIFRGIESWRVGRYVPAKGDERGRITDSISSSSSSSSSQGSSEGDDPDDAPPIETLPKIDESFEEDSGESL